MSFHVRTVTINRLSDTSCSSNSLQFTPACCLRQELNHSSPKLEMSKGVMALSRKNSPFLPYFPYLLSSSTFLCVTMTSNNIFFFTEGGQVEGLVAHSSIFLPQQQRTAWNYYASFTNDIQRVLTDCGKRLCVASVPAFPAWLLHPFISITLWVFCWYHK